MIARGGFRGRVQVSFSERQTSPPIPIAKRKEKEPKRKEK